MAENIVTEEIRSESHVAFWIYAKDFFFIMIYVYGAYLLRGMVATPFQIPYMIFSFVFAVVFTLPSPFNKKRRIYQSLLIYIKRDYMTYHPARGDREE